MFIAVGGLAPLSAKQPVRKKPGPVHAPATAKPVAAKPAGPDAPAPAAISAASEKPRAHPIGNPAKWFPADAYPPAARNAGQEGRTGFMVKVDARGRVTECDIVQSSGSIILDNTTCDLVVSNGHFTPAVDAAGKPVDGIWQSAMRWQLVVTEPSFEDGDR